jgi:hypothetical protein
MNKNKLSLLIAIVAAVVVLAGGWFLGVQPQLSTASANDAQRATIDSTNASNKQTLAQLQEQYKQLAKSKATLADLQKSVPASAKTDDFTREIDAAANASGVSVTSITYGTTTAYTPSTTTATTTTGSSSTATASPSASATAAATTAPAAPATPAAPQPYQNAQVTSANFDLIPVTIAVDAPLYGNALVFTKALQSGQRLFLIDTLSQTTKDSSYTNQSWSLEGYIYVLDTTSASTASSSTSSTSGSTTGTSTSAEGATTTSANG